MKASVETRDRKSVTVPWRLETTVIDIQCMHGYGEKTQNDTEANGKDENTQNGETEDEGKQIFNYYSEGLFTRGTVHLVV